MNEQKFMKENTIILENRNHLSITGVEKVIAFSETNVTLVAMNACMQISGQQMHTEKLDVSNGNLEVSGIINQIKFETKKEKVPFLKRIFR